MYVLFTSIPLVGHANPLLRQAEELQRRGHRVAFAGARDLQRHVTAEAPTIPFIDLGPLGPIADQIHRAQIEASLDPVFLRNSLRIVEPLWATWLSMYDGITAAIAADRPDVAVIDSFSTGGITAADHAGVPCVVNAILLGVLSLKLLPPADHLPFLFSGRSRHRVTAWDRMIAPLKRHIIMIGASILAGGRINRLRAKRNLPPIDVHALHRHRQVLVDGAFGLEYERPLPPNIAMVGAMVRMQKSALPPDLDMWLSTGPPVVFVSLGTLAIAPAQQLARMAAAFANDAFRTLWSLKPDQAALLPPASITSNLRTVEWAPQPAVLAHPNVKVFVSHCGSNSVHESVHAGKPIVGIPMFGDQQDLALRVADAGIGVWLNKQKFTTGQLREAILRVLGDKAFGEAMVTVQRAVAAAGGVSRAADLIEAQAPSAAT